MQASAGPDATGECGAWLVSCRGGSDGLVTRLPGDRTRVWRLASEDSPPHGQFLYSWGQPEGVCPNKRLVRAFRGRPGARETFSIADVCGLGCRVAAPAPPPRTATTYPISAVLLYGRIARAEQINPARGLKLRRAFERIDWSASARR